MFVSNQQKRINPILFFNDKSLPMGSYTERVVTPVLDCWFNPTGSGAYKYLFEMNQEKKFVTQEEDRPGVTPAQASLLALLDGPNGLEIHKQLLTVIELSVYFVERDLFNRDASWTSLELCKAIGEINKEFITTQTIIA